MNTFFQHISAYKMLIDFHNRTDSSEDSSDSSDEDDVSLNSKTDIGALYFDENVCPKDCDQSLYDLTLTLRSRRQSLESSNRFCQSEIENIKKTLTNLNRKLAEHEKQLGIYNRELIESMVCYLCFFDTMIVTLRSINFQKEKQNMINEVNHLVILRMHQLQYFSTKEELYAVDKSIVFDVSVFNKLFARVGELELETIESQRKHRFLREDFFFAVTPFYTYSFIELTLYIWRE